MSVFSRRVCKPHLLCQCSIQNGHHEEALNLLIVTALTN